MDTNKVEEKRFRTELQVVFGAVKRKGNRKEIAISMLEEGFSLEMIAKITKESIEVIADLVKEIQSE